MKGLYIALGVVSGIFNLVMFLWCVKLRNDCIVIAESFKKATDSVKKSIDNARNDVQGVSDQISKFLEDLLDEECDGDSEGENS